MKVKWHEATVQIKISRSFGIDDAAGTESGILSVERSTKDFARVTVMVRGQRLRQFMTLSVSQVVAAIRKLSGRPLPIDI